MRIILSWGCRICLQKTSDIVRLSSSVHFYFLQQLGASMETMTLELTKSEIRVLWVIYYYSIHSKTLHREQIPTLVRLEFEKPVQFRTLDIILRDLITKNCIESDEKSSRFACTQVGQNHVTKLRKTSPNLFSKAKNPQQLMSV